MFQENRLFQNPPKVSVRLQNTFIKYSVLCLTCFGVTHKIISLLSFLWKQLPNAQRNEIEESKWQTFKAKRGRLDVTCPRQPYQVIAI